MESPKPVDYQFSSISALFYLGIAPLYHVGDTESDALHCNCCICENGEVVRSGGRKDVGSSFEWVTE